MSQLMDKGGKVIEFPNKPENIRDLISVLEDFSEQIECASVLIDMDGRSFFVSFNVNASIMAFHALLLQKEALVAGELLLETDHL